MSFEYKVVHYVTRRGYTTIVLPCADTIENGGDCHEDSLGAATTGSVAQCLPFWDKICSKDSFVPKWLRFGFPLVWKAGPATPFYSPNGQGALRESVFVSGCVKELLAVGAAKKWPHRPKVVNPLNVVPKKNGKLRLILDQRHVNEFLKVPKFKFEKLRDLESFVTPGDNMIGIDLTNGYWQVPMHPDYFEYMGFEWEGEFYVFCVLPFGLSSAPWCFAKVMKAFCGHLRGSGVKVLNYLDDFLFFLGTDPRDIKAARQIILRAFIDAGLTINLNKSHLSPTTQLKSLGIIVDTLHGTFTVPDDRWNNFQGIVAQLLANNSGTARSIAAAVGHAVSMSLAVGQPSRLFTRACLNLLLDCKGWDYPLTLTSEAMCELEFWRDANRSNLTSPIWCPRCERVWVGGGGGREHRPRLPVA